MRLNKMFLLGVCTFSLCVGGVSQAHGARMLTEMTAHKSMMRGIGQSSVYIPSASNIHTPIRRISMQKTHPQVYGVATYDALFKYVLSQDSVRPSFFKAFIPELQITSSARLDDHMRPVQELQLLRKFLNDPKTLSVAKRLTPVSDIEVHIRNGETINKDDDATMFLHEMIGRFEEIKTSFPKSGYDGTMDFVCELSNHDFALVEMQVIPENCWDRRALAYVAAFYGNQLKKGAEWRDIKKVIGINILGGGKDDLHHWVDTPTQFFRHYKVQEQTSQPVRFIDGIELLQYSIMNAPKVLPDQEKQDWITYFKKGHYMTEEDVNAKIHTPSVLEAFNLAKISELPSVVRAKYEAEDKKYSRYSEFTAEQVQKKAIEIARKMLVRQRPLDEIIEDTGLTEDEINAIK